MRAASAWRYSTRWSSRETTGGPTASVRRACQASSRLDGLTAASTSTAPSRSQQRAGDDGLDRDVHGERHPQRRRVGRHDQRVVVGKLGVEGDRHDHRRPGGRRAQPDQRHRTARPGGGPARARPLGARPSADRHAPPPPGPRRRGSAGTVPAASASGRSGRPAPTSPWRAGRGGCDRSDTAAHAPPPARRRLVEIARHQVDELGFGGVVESVGVRSFMSCSSDVGSRPVVRMSAASPTPWPGR